MFNLLFSLAVKTNLNLSTIALITVYVIILIISVISLFILLFDPSWFSRRISIIKALKSRIFVRNAMENKELQKAVKKSGFNYDWKQDIFYSLMNPWQRDYGYCRLYDELCPPFGMIVDSDPVYFYYGNKNWLIEFWKGQYDLTTGCEVGIYTKSGVELDHPNAALYSSASNSDRLFISYILKKNHKIVLKREDKHWWLTGFRLGEFSEPSELSMEISITFKNKKMRDAFVTGLMNAHYTENEYNITGNTVNISFKKPRSNQPFTRNPVTDSITQEKNFILCKEFVNITADEENMSGKMKAIEEKSPELLKYILNIGKTRMFFDKIKEE